MTDDLARQVAELQKENERLRTSYPDGVVVQSETCEYCGERVRYWNEGSFGNASCACCQEGPEVCARKHPEVGDVVFALLSKDTP